MRSRFIVTTGVALLALAFITGFTTGRTVDDGPALKSLHLLNLPDGVSEEDLAAALTAMNKAIREAGHHGGYRLWKVTGEQAGEYGYMWEGNWPSQEAYDAIHQLEAYQQPDFGGVDYEVIGPLEVYNRYVEIATAGHCCTHMEHGEHMQHREYKEQQQQKEQQEQKEQQGR